MPSGGSSPSTSRMWRAAGLTAVDRILYAMPDVTVVCGSAKLG